MSVKVLIVDDEHLERTLILRGTDWQGNGFEVIGEAQSAKAALEMIAADAPDIVFTDINMPQMDGLELAEKIKEAYPQIKLVIITGYREFEYAQKALRIGVTEFLLKPINSGEVLRISLKLKEQIIEQRNFMGEVRYMKLQLSEGMVLLREKILNDMVHGRPELKDTDAKLEKHGLDFLKGGIICMVARIKGPKELEEAEAIQLKKAAQDLLEAALLKKGQAVSFHSGENEIAGIASCKDTAGVQAACEYAVSALREELNCNATIGIGRPNIGPDGIEASYREACEALKARVIFGNNRVIPFSALTALEQESSVLPEINRNEFSVFVRNGMRDKALELIKDYMGRIARSGPLEIEVLRLLCANIISAATAVMFEIDGELYSSFSKEYNVYHEIGKIETLDDMEQALSFFTREVMCYIADNMEKKPHVLAREAKAYIAEHLTEVDLSLSSIAKSLYANECYLSRIFKKETGQNLSDYIMRQRLDKAMSYLKDSDLKAYEVAQRIGFADPHYFGICFKKYTGKSINEFRKGK